jgi:uncharacterized protein (TIGR03437 family)
LIYVQKDQINAQAPAANSNALDVVVVANPGQANEMRSAPVKVTLQPTAPALFLVGGAPRAVALFRGTATLVGDPASIPGAKPAAPGDQISLYATGLGPASPAVLQGQITPGLSTVTSSLAVSIGGISLGSADIFYAGLAPGLINGLYQLDVRVPTSVSSGDVPVVITAGGKPSADGITLRVGR